MKLKAEGRESIILSFSQFRPEKDHEKQFRIVKKLVEKNPKTDLKLVILSC